MEPFDCDLLEDRSRSDVLWSLKRFRPQGYKYAQQRNPKQIKSDVLSARRVQYAIQKTAEEKNKTVDSVTEDVKEILDEMGHNFNLSSIRVMAVMLRKILCTLFRKVLVNREGIERLRDAAKNNPVVFIPSHRSYMDFLLVSYVCFALDIPLPFIAAAADFMNMRVIRTLFRNSGAFYMRRSFMSDPLYWVVFTEYIQNQLQIGNQPLEFFLEGTRSRTGKFLHPKLGVLSMVVDLFTNAGVPDIIICPISISYDRILEESPCVYELLGIPKPRESLKGLIKSRFVLSENYGSIHIHIGELLPLSKFTEGKLSRVDSACVPRHLFHFLSNEEKKVVKSLGYKILSDLQAGMINPSCALVACIMLQNLQGLHFDELVEKFTWLKELCHMWQIPVKSAGETDNASLVNESLDFLKASVEKTGDGFVKLVNSQIEESDVQSTSSSPDKRLHLATAASNIQHEAAVHIRLACKRNVILYYFFRTGILSLSAQRQADPDKDLVQLFADFQFLTQLLIKEVAALSEQSDQSFQHFRETVHLLEQHGSVFIKNSRATILQERDITFTADLWRPILTAYWITCHFFIDLRDGTHERPLVEIVKMAQDKAAELVLTGDVKFYEVLSLDLLRNSVLSLVDMQAVKASKSVDGGILISVPNKARLSEIYQKMGQFLDVSGTATVFPPTLSKL